MRTKNLAKKDKTLGALGVFANTHIRDNFDLLNVENFGISHSTI